MNIEIGIVAQPSMPGFVDYVVEAERLGAAAVWLPEYWAHDALTPLGLIAGRTEQIRLGTAIVQIGARSPAMLAMSAMTLQELSGGRFILGIGASGPQVMEGWHGVDFGRPITRTAETIDIVEMITVGAPLEYDGKIYHLPLPGGEGKAIRSAALPTKVPIYLASLGPANLRLTGARADGWIGNSFFCETSDVFFDQIAAGAASVGRQLSDLNLTVAVSCEITDDIDLAGRRHAAGYAFTFGAMGSTSTNFYNQAFERQGFGDAVAEVQRLWKEGDRAAAAAAVPVEIGLRTNLIGPPDEIGRRLRQYQNAGVSQLRVNPMGSTLDEHVAGLGQLIDLARGAEPGRIGRRPMVE